MPKILIDTDLYISFIRTGRFEETIRGLYTFRVRDIFFSSVVAGELLHGALDKKGIKSVETLYRPFEKVGRLVTPHHGDWLETGRLLSKIRNARKDLHTKTPRLMNDGLIAMSARRIGAMVYTSNANDFELMAKYRDFQFEIVG